MRLGTVLWRSEPRVVSAGPDGEVRDVSAQLGGDLRAAIADGRVDALTDASSGEVLPPGAFRWLPPIPSPRRILCAGMNYRGHAEETGSAVPTHPSLFVRFPSSFVGHGELLMRPPESDLFDWEGEIAVIIGRRGRRIAAERALDHVAGYAPLGEHSIRDYQLHSRQATAGKNFDASGSWGPWLVTADEVSAPEDLALRLSVNGEVMQQGRLSDLIFGVDELIAYASVFTTLEPGDVIATGTPAGVGFQRTPPRYLVAGDEVAIELIGHVRLENRVADDRPRG